MRKCVIMPLFGISGEGSLGECAYCFADRVAEIGAGYWLLPSLGENYADGIDLELLSMDGLLTHAEIEARFLRGIRTHAPRRVRRRLRAFFALRVFRSIQCAYALCLVPRRHRYRHIAAKRRDRVFAVVVY